MQRTGSQLHVATTGCPLAVSFEWVAVRVCRDGGIA
jgi:hypothetical protein